MPDTTNLSLSGSLDIAGLTAAELANSVLHLFKAGEISPPPTITTPVGSFTAAECDFSGYASITIAAVGDLALIGNAWSIVVNERFDPTPAGVTVGNQVGGWYWVTAAGKLIEYGVFEPTRPAQAPGQTIFVTCVLPITAGQVA